MRSENSQNVQWWLYCQDIKFARQKQWDAILNASNPREKANELAMMTYLGVYSECEEEILRHNLTEYKNGRYALYRARRALGAKNIWESLVSEKKEIESIIKEIDKVVETGGAICVNLVGGIGDQLEAASLLLGQKEIYTASKGPIIEVKATGDNKLAVAEYLKRTDAKKIIASKQSLDRLNISYPLYRYWHEIRSEVQLVYKKLDNIEARTVVDDKKQNLLVCWRCKMNKENMISSFGRSIPFRIITELMELMKEEIEDESINIIDITNYSAQETKIMSKNYPKIKFAGETINSINSLARVISLNDMVVSVDTSLVHITATCNRHVHALLPKYADERWLELMGSEGMYKKNIIIHKQRDFHDWNICRDLILKTIMQKK